MSYLNTNSNPFYVRFLPSGELVAAEPQPERDVLGPQNPTRHQVLQSLSLAQITLNQRSASRANSVEDISCYLSPSLKRRKRDEKENAQTSSITQPAEENKVDFSQLHGEALDQILAWVAGQGSKAFGLTCKKVYKRYQVLEAPLYEALPSTLYQILKVKLEDYKRKLIAFESSGDRDENIYIPYPSSKIFIPTFEEFLDIFEYDYFYTEKFPHLNVVRSRDGATGGSKIKALAFVSHLIRALDLADFKRSDEKSVVRAVKNLDLTSKAFLESQAEAIDSPIFKPEHLKKIVKYFIDYRWFVLNIRQIIANNQEPDDALDQSQEDNFDGVDLNLVENLKVDYLACFPPCLQKLTQLQSLDASFVGLKELPEEFFNLTGLKSLDLDDNYLTEVPRDLQKLTRLTHLSFACNELSHFPEGLSALINLETLWMNNNELNQRPNFDLRVLTNLTGLYLKENPLKGVFQIQEIMGLTRLEEVHINDKAIMRAFYPDDDEISSDSEDLSSEDLSSGDLAQGDDDLSDSSDFELDDQADDVLGYDSNACESESSDFEQ